MKGNVGPARSFSHYLFLPPLFAIVVLLAAVALGARFAAATPWAPTGSTFVPAPSNLVPGPKIVTGKDFSDIRDRDLNGLPDPERVVAWDGSGGVRNSFDYSGSRVAYPDVLPDREVDGIAAGGDALFHAVRNNTAALLISVEGNPGIHYERQTGLPGSFPGTGIWAKAVDIDNMNPPIDTDGLELWGADQFDDSDRYSLAGDPFTDFVVPNESRKVAIWSYNAAGNTSIHHTLTTDLAAAMDLQLPLGGVGVGGPHWGQLVELLDVDAIMTFGTQVTFSIRPITYTITTPAGPVVFTFDGGEIFEYDGPAVPTRYLNHGGHLWDTLFDVRATFGVLSENVDALEAVAGIPEPSTVVLLMLAAALPLRLLRRTPAF